MNSTVEQVTTADGHMAEVCTITHDGHSFTAMGAILDPENLYAYCMENGKLATWEGERIGQYWVNSTYYNGQTKMECIGAYVNDRWYHGRKSADWSQLIHLRPSKSA